MITLRQLPYIDILSLNDMMSFDTKVNIIEHCKLARIDIPKSWRKAQIADALADIFTKDPLWTLEVLPEEELEKFYDKYAFSVNGACSKSDLSCLQQAGSIFSPPYSDPAITIRHNRSPDNTAHIRYTEFPHMHPFFVSFHEKAE